MDEKGFLLKEKYAGVASPAFEADCARIDAGEPLAYVIGWVPFLDCKIYLDSHPLIPRSETEYWVEKAILEMKMKSGETRILDLFAGSGAVGVAVLKHVPEALVDFGEIETAHLNTIQKNIIENGIKEPRGRVIKTDVFEGITDTYDFILANPPYISKNLTKRVERSVLEHEPHAALFAEEEGFALIRHLIEGAPTCLSENGTMYIEHEPEQAESVKNCARESNFTAETMNDQFGRVRFSRLVRVA